MKKKLRLRLPKIKKPKKLAMPKWLAAIGRPIGKVLKKLGFVLIVFRPLRPVGRYFAGAWHELRQVTWPTRAVTFKLTLACILFTAVMTGFIVALDYGFDQLVKRVLFT